MVKWLFRAKWWQKDDSIVHQKNQINGENDVQYILLVMTIAITISTLQIFVRNWIKDHQSVWWDTN